MKILVPNLGSTSLKWRLFDFTGGEERLLHKGGFERVSDYPAAVENCLGELKRAGVLADERELAGIGFKTIIAKGITGCVRIDDVVLGAMEAYNGLAPAHNPPYIAGIRLFGKRIPGVPLVALFETAFYQFAPESMMRYAVPESWHEAGIRRWGFHGASHKFIAERSAELLGRPDVAERVRRLYARALPAGSLVRANGSRAPFAPIDSPGEESESSSAAARANGGGAPFAPIDSPGEESESSSAAARANGGGAPFAPIDSPGK